MRLGWSILERENNMGLDVTSYYKVELVVAAEVDELEALGLADRDEDAETYLWEGPCVNRMAPLVPGFYRTTGACETFRAGSYGGYNYWRSELAKIAGLSSDRSAFDSPGPFAELVYFADNEGTIGPMASAKLATDFAEWHGRAKAHASLLDDDGWFMCRYEDWWAAFNLAKNGGAVQLT